MRFFRVSVIKVASSRIELVNYREQFDLRPFFENSVSLKFTRCSLRERERERERDEFILQRVIREFKSSLKHRRFFNFVST